MPRTQRLTSNLGPRGPRLSLYDTSGHSNLKRFATSQFSKNTNPASTPHPFQIFMCVRSSEFVSGMVVGLGGLEPPASPLSGVRSNHLSYRPKSRARLVWWSLSGSNRRPPACKAGALPAELWPRVPGRSECRSLVRTPDRQCAVFCL